MGRKLTALGVRQRCGDRDLDADLWTTPALQEESTKGYSGLRQSIRLRFEALASSHYGYPPTSVLNNSPASRRAMASNQASEVSVQPLLHSSFPSRKPRRDIVPFRLDRRSSSFPAVSYAAWPMKLAS